MQQQGTKNAVRQVNCLWADLDAKDFKGGKSEALQNLRGFPLLPTIIVDSGNGYHAYWLLKEPEAISNDSDVAQIEGCNRGLAKALGADASACDLARVLRLPGTWNVKDPANPLDVQVVECEPSRQYNFSEFDWLPQAEQERTPAYESLTQGPIQAGQRHTTLLSFGGLLRQKGFPASVIKTVLEAMNGSVCTPPLSADEVQTIVRSLGNYPQGAAASPAGVPEVIELAPIDLSGVDEPGERVDLVEGLLPQGYPSVLYGDGGHGKSYIALAIATSVKLGQPFLGLAAQPSGVLYLDWELEQDEMTRRAYKIARGLGLERPPQGLQYVRADRPFSELLESIKTFVKERGVGLVVLDSLGPACGGDPEQARCIIPLLTHLRDLQATVLVIDHQSKLHQGQDYDRKTPFGSVYKYNLARSVIQVQRVESGMGQLKLILRQTKCNFGPLRESIPVCMNFAERAVRLACVDLQTDPAFYEHLKAEDKILRSLGDDGPATRKLLATRTGIHEGTVGNVLPRLKEAGTVQEVSKDGNAPVYGLVRPTPPTGLNSSIIGPDGVRNILTEETDLG